MMRRCWLRCANIRTAHGTPRAPRERTFPLFGDITGTETDHGREFTFSYIPPQRYRVILVTEDGSVRVSEEVYERARFFETMTLDCDTMTLTPYYDIPFAKIAQQLFATLVPTLLIEGLLLVLFGLARNRRNLLCFLWTNLATQLVLTGVSLVYAAGAQGSSSPICF